MDGAPIAACGLAQRRMLAGTDAAVNDNAAVAVATGMMLRQNRVRSEGSSRNGVQGGNGWMHKGWGGEDTPKVLSPPPPRHSSRPVLQGSGTCVLGNGKIIQPQSHNLSMGHCWFLGDLALVGVWARSHCKAGGVRAE